MTLLSRLMVFQIFFFEKMILKKKSAGNETHAKLPSILIDTYPNRMANSKLNYICGRFNTSHCACGTMSNYLDFFLSMGDKICHSPFKKVKIQHNLFLSFPCILIYLRDSQMIQAEIPLASYVTQGVSWGVCDFTVRTHIQFTLSS